MQDSRYLISPVEFNGFSAFACCHGKASEDSHKNSKDAYLCRDSSHMGILLSRAGMGSHPTLTPRRHTALLPPDTTLLLSQHMVRVPVAAAYTQLFSDVRLQHGFLTLVLLYQLQECKSAAQTLRPKCLCYICHQQVLNCHYTVAETASKAKCTVQNHHARDPHTEERHGRYKCISVSGAACTVTAAAEIPHSWGLPTGWWGRSPG